MGSARVVILTTVGANSGKLRKVPVIRVEHDGTYAAVASASGAASHPGWYFNLKKHPQVDLQDGPLKETVTAHEAVGEERALWWQRALECNPQYADYQAKVSRVIPVIVLEPDPH